MENGLKAGVSEVCLVSKVLMTEYFKRLGHSMKKFEKNTKLCTSKVMLFSALQDHIRGSTAVE